MHSSLLLSVLAHLSLSFSLSLFSASPSPLLSLFTPTSYSHSFATLLVLLPAVQLVCLLESGPSLDLLGECGVDCTKRI